MKVVLAVATLVFNLSVGVVYAATAQSEADKNALVLKASNKKLCVQEVELIREAMDGTDSDYS